MLYPTSYIPLTERCVDDKEGVDRNVGPPIDGTTAWAGSRGTTVSSYSD